MLFRRHGAGVTQFGCYYYVASDALSGFAISSFLPAARRPVGTVADDD